MDWLPILYCSVVKARYIKIHKVYDNIIKIQMIKYASKTGLNT